MDSVTIAKRPSVGTGWRIDKAVSTKRKNGKFFARAIDTGIVKQPAGKITQSRRTGSRSRKPPLYRRRAADYASLIRPTSFDHFASAVILKAPEVSSFTAVSAASPMTPKATVAAICSFRDDTSNA